MKRVLVILAAAASTTVLAPGATGAASADENTPRQGVTYVAISEVATRGVGPAATFQDYIEIRNRSNRFWVKIGGMRLEATFAGQVHRLAEISKVVFLPPREVYTIGHARFTGCEPDQVFDANLPGSRFVQLALLTPRGAQVDAASISPHPPRLSGHRVAFTGAPTDFVMGPRTPCVPDDLVPAPVSSRQG